MLAGTISQIEEKLGLTSQNSSQPPAGDPQPQGERRRGGQKGFGRQLYDPSECQEIEAHRPDPCQHGQSELSEKLPASVTAAEA
ncbi:MAG: hypothetical protein HC910_12330 [Spirulinaceae cyanobacterium SM2_1_0]|nr:hypothetical protein [Spirulinaceae cyanobacterium SM2_1_0]